MCVWVGVKVEENVGLEINKCVMVKYSPHLGKARPKVPTDMSPHPLGGQFVTYGLVSGTKKKPTVFALTPIMRELLPFQTVRNKCAIMPHD